MKKHLIIHDAELGEEYEVEEVGSSEPDEEIFEEEKEEEIKPEPEAEEKAEEKEICEAVFTEEEIAALKELISLVPTLKTLLEGKSEAKEEVEEEAEEEQPKEVEEEKELEIEDVEDEEDEEESDEDESFVGDSIGAIEQSNVADSESYNSYEAEMAIKFKNYYNGGK